ncbi:MAG TPA: hypothetical protein VMF11_15230 [Candidatus Baltobacteraceae bacterium]|nr:hypothetical protein [Candidatus Baltobacteraceae bacterium]
MRFSIGRYVYGSAVIGLGIVALAWHDLSNWEAMKALAGLPLREILSDIVGALEVLGGLAVLWPRTVRAGAFVLGLLYFILALLWVPFIVAHPLLFDGYGNFFEVFAFVSGAMLLTARWARIGYYSFGISVITFALYQLFYLSYTASLVPTWVPPSQMFWSVATTIAFALAAVALLTGLWALLAARLNTVMLLSFGLLVWVPRLFADPHRFSNWTEAFETLGIAGSAWIAANYLARRARAGGDG